MPLRARARSTKGWPVWVGISLLAHVLTALLLPRDVPATPEAPHRRTRTLIVALVQSPIVGVARGSAADGPATPPNETAAPAAGATVAWPSISTALAETLLTRMTATASSSAGAWRSSGGWTTGGSGTTGESGADGHGGGGTPFVPRLERMPWPQYPSQHAESSARTVRVRVLVGRSGLVEEAVLESANVPAPFAEEALAVARLARFSPAMRDGEPTACWTVLPITFHPK